MKQLTEEKNLNVEGNIMSTIKNRYDFVIYFQVKYGNPNGDPDANGSPRIGENNHGLMSDVSIKNRIRQYVDSANGYTPGLKTFLNPNVAFSRSNALKEEYLGIKKDAQSLCEEDPDIDYKIRDFLCKNFFDVRAFGTAVEPIKKGALNGGQILGPVQLSFAKSLDPIYVEKVAMISSAFRSDEDFENNIQTTYYKYIIPYALYRCEGHISPNIAQKSTGFTEDDLELLWHAILHMFRGTSCSISTRELIIFKHDSKYGNASCQELFDKISVEKKSGVEFPENFRDYEFRVDEMPAGVTCIRRDF